MVQIGIIGCGQVGMRLARLFAKNHTVFVLDQEERRVLPLLSEGIRRAEDFKQLATESDIIVLAVKPQNLQQIKPLGSYLHRGHILVSVLAGVSSDALRQRFKKPRIVRIAPNLALGCGKGICGIEESGLTDAMRQQMEALFQEGGDVVFLPASQMESLMALSGSGLALVAAMIEGVVDGAIAIGLKPEMALKLVPSVFEGAIGLLRHEGLGPQALRWAVSSPAGTTVEALQVMEDRSVRGAISAALRAAHRRSKEIGQDV